MNDALLEKLSTEDLEKLAANDMEGMSDEGLKTIQETDSTIPPSVPEPAQDAPMEEWDQYYKETIKPRAGEFVQAGAGAVEGVESLPFGKRILENVPGGSKLQEFAQSVPQPDDVSGSLYRGIGRVAPMLPATAGLGMGVKALSTLPKLAALAGPGAHMATTMGSYGALRSAANQEGNPLVEGLKGAATGGLMGKVGQFGANLLPRQIPGAERLGSAIGGASATAGLDAVFNPEAPAHEKLANVIMGGTMDAAFPSRRKVDLNTANRAKLMKQTIDRTMQSINMRPTLTRKTGASFNDARNKLSTAWYNVWKNGKSTFTGKDGTPMNSQEVLDAITTAKNLEIKNMKTAEQASMQETVIQPYKQTPIMTTIQVKAKNGKWINKEVPKLDKQGQPMFKTEQLDPKKQIIQMFTLDGNDLARSLQSTMTQNKKLLEAAGDYDITAIRKRLTGLRGKTFTIDDVDGLLAELNKSYGKTTVQAKIDKALADTLRERTEKVLDGIEHPVTGTIGHSWRQARRNWGALRDLESQFLKIHARAKDQPESIGTEGLEGGSKLVNGIQTGLRAATDVPRAAMGAIDMALAKYRNIKSLRSKNPMEKVQNMFKELDRQNNLRTLNQEMSDLYKQGKLKLPQMGLSVENVGPKTPADQLKFWQGERNLDMYKRDKSYKQRVENEIKKLKK